MGWTSFAHKGRSNMEILRDEFNDLNIVEKSETKDCVYFAVKSKKTGEVFTAVIPVERSGGDFSFKVMSEDMGPYYYGASRKVLDALTPTDMGYSKKWRAECRKQMKPERVVRKDAFAGLFA